MVQQGQTIELTRRGLGGERLWAYRYRTGGRDSKRVQRGGFASEQDARDALERELDRLRRERRIPRRLTLAELALDLSLSVSRTDNARRVRDGYISLSACGHPRALATHAEGPICTTNVIANARACNGKEGVEGRRFESVRGLQLPPCLVVVFVLRADAGGAPRRPRSVHQ